MNLGFAQITFERFLSSWINFKFDMYDMSFLLTVDQSLRREQFKSVKSTYYLIPCAVSIRSWNGLCADLRLAKDERYTLWSPRSVWVLSRICINALFSVGYLLNLCSSWVMCYLEGVWHEPLSPHCRRDWQICTVIRKTFTSSAWNLINLEIPLLTCFQGFKKQICIIIFDVLYLLA